MSKWTDPKSLSQYKQGLRLPGLYVIGRSRDSKSPPSPSHQSDPYLLENWPINFQPEYVGISEAKAPGVRGRLSCHARYKGSKHVAQLLKDGVDLYFIAIYGAEATGFEALFIALKMPHQFEGNKRAEHDRAAKKRYDKIRSEMTQYERDYYDNLDVEGDGM
jgi:hypothetical protein